MYGVLMWIEYKYVRNVSKWPIPVDARSKAYDYGPSFAEIVGSNHTADMDVCLL
jgi:hypothetical protein